MAEPIEGPGNEEDIPGPSNKKSSRNVQMFDRDVEASAEFAAMSVEARTWHIYRKQVRLYRMIAVLLGLDPDTVQVPWELQVELAGLIKEAREDKGEEARRRERRVTTLVNISRYVLGGLALAGTLKLITLVLSGVGFLGVTGK